MIDEMQDGDIIGLVKGSKNKVGRKINGLWARLKLAHLVCEWCFELTFFVW